MTGEHFIRNGLPPDAPEVPDDEDSILQPTAHTTSGEASLNNDMEEDDDDATGSLETISLPQSTQLDEAATGADMSSELGVENDDENGTNEDDQSVDESILQRYLNRRIEVAGDDDDDASSLGGSVIAKRGKARTPAKKGVKRKASKGKAVPKKKKGKTVASDTAGAPVDAEEGNDSDSSLGSEGPTPSKRMTARQLAKLHGGIELGEMDLELADERPSKRKQYTAEEIALRKSENARRRKHQADTRAEEAKINTINKLLRKQATKKRAKEEVRPLL
ncbi:hypothetical protein BC832DRAFT_537113 [Gaertneriomyces semiglobifer]|nr:hypothetical protein BC832DRAFT_537113 [Gaertneriomyces semiglobifer]